MPTRMKRQARTRAAALPATAAAAAPDDIHVRRSAPLSSRRHAAGPPSRFRRWMLGGLLGVLALSPSPAGAFSTDGLHSGMTLDEVKKVLISQGRNLDYMFKVDGEEMFGFERENYLRFCQGKLVAYSRHIKNADLFNSDRNDLNNILFDRVSINNNDGFIINRTPYFYYMNESYWNAGNEGGSLIFYSITRLLASEISQVDAIKDEVFLTNNFRERVFAYIKNASHRESTWVFPISKYRKWIGVLKPIVVSMVLSRASQSGLASRASKAFRFAIRSVCASFSSASKHGEEKPVLTFRVGV